MFHQWERKKHLPQLPVTGWDMLVLGRALQHPYGTHSSTIGEGTVLIISRMLSRILSMKHYLVSGGGQLKQKNTRQV